MLCNSYPLRGCGGWEAIIYITTDYFRYSDSNAVQQTFNELADAFTSVGSIVYIFYDMQMFCCRCFVRDMSTHIFFLYLLFRNIFVA